MTILGRFARWY